MILGILQARTGSSRLPGKVLRPILGVPLITRVTERIARAQALDALVVATTVEQSDDELVRWLEAHKVVVRRGSLDDVLGRFVGVIEEFEPETVVRLTGDNVLTDPAVIDRVVRAHLAGVADYTSNSQIRTYPRGLDVEVVRAEALRQLNELSLSGEEREHVTMGLYRRPEMFRVASVSQSPDRSGLRWTVDYEEDFAFAEAVYRDLYPRNPAFGQADVLEFLERNPAQQVTDSDVASWAVRGDCGA